MKFYEKDIESYQKRVTEMQRIQDTLDHVGLAPDMPAICLSEKKVIMLSDKIDIKIKKDTVTGESHQIILIAGYSPKESGGKWYDHKDLVQYCDSTRILYLK